MNRIWLFLLFFPLTTKAQTTSKDWFAEARLGIFIHWGVYAVERH